MINAHYLHKQNYNVNHFYINYTYFNIFSSLDFIQATLFLYSIIIFKYKFVNKAEKLQTNKYFKYFCDQTFEFGIVWQRVMFQKYTGRVFSTFRKIL